jgi:hypothetical protein
MRSEVIPKINSLINEQTAVNIKTPTHKLTLLFNASESRSVMLLMIYPKKLGKKKSDNDPRNMNGHPMVNNHHCSKINLQRNFLCSFLAISFFTFLVGACFSEATLEA